MTKTIGGVTVTAPIFNGATEQELLNIVLLLSSASFHYADDSGTEWGLAAGKKQEAAKEVNRLKLSAGAIKLLYADAPQLISYEDFLDAILRDARK